MIFKHKKVAIIGYGSQGRAQALNLRDSGIRPVIGLPPSSKSRIKAGRDRFKVATPLKAISESEIIAILIPDHLHKSFFETIPAELLNGKSLIFAHGLSVAFGLIKLPSKCDIILVAPHGPGVRLRELYKAGQPFTAFWAVERNASGKAERIARDYASAIGCRSKGLFKTTFRDEAIGDIFGEQAVLCGGLAGLIKSWSRRWNHFIAKSKMASSHEH